MTRGAERCSGEHIRQGRPTTEDRVDGTQVIRTCGYQSVTASLQVRCVITHQVLEAFGTMSQDCSEAVGDVLDIAMAGYTEALQCTVQYI